MPKRPQRPTMDETAWRTATDPHLMIRYLEQAGCYFEFEAFYQDCFDRIRREFRTREVIDCVYDNGENVDDLTDAARAAIESLEEELAECKPESKKALKLAREIRFSKAVLMRDYHDFGELNRCLSAYLIEIADDPNVEVKTQIKFLRSNYPFPFVGAPEEE